MFKEFHAYKNEDGTYRVEGIGYVVENEITREVRVEIPCVQLTIDPFMPKEDDATFLFEIKENADDLVDFLYGKCLGCKYEGFCNKECNPENKFKYFEAKEN